MTFKYAPVVAFTLLTALQMPAHAGFVQDLFKGGPGKAFGNLSCKAWTSKTNDMALASYERMSTPLPKGALRKVVPFRESDFQTKPWMRQYEIVVVVNNSSPYQHYTEFPAQHPIPYSMADLGLSQDMDENDSAAASFMNNYGSEAQKVRKFGELVLEKSGPGGEKKPVPSNIQGAQTVRIYQRGQLIRVAKVSTGRGIFELRDKVLSCSRRPDKSYFSITEPGYYNFQELIKSGYESGEWDNASMPNAMFYKRGRGLALHEVNLPVKLADLGKRASGGCTRLDPDTASNLFDLIQSTQGATIPVLDEQGNPVYDQNGQLTYKNRETIIYGEGSRNELRQTAKSYSALLIIQPDAVADANSYRDQSVSFKYRIQ